MTSLQKASLEEIRSAATRICRDYLTGRWKTITPEQIIVKRISGGLSNFLYYVSLPDAAATTAREAINRNEHACLDLESADESSAKKRQRTHSTDERNNNVTCAFMPGQAVEPQEVLLRVYGQTHGGAGDALEAMITESVVFALLSERNFGPKLHGIFPGGRIEQFIPARALVTRELAHHNISMKIAEKMGEIHSLNIPMSKEPDWLWNCMERWLSISAKILERTDWKDAELPLIEVVRGLNYVDEASWLKSVIQRGNYPVLFCHNDLQEGNILFREDDSISRLGSNLEKSGISDDLESSVGDYNVPKRKRSKSANANNNDDNGNEKPFINDNTSQQWDNSPDLIIIDFEYCAYNYRGFDLANHFLEWTFDYTNPEFPLFFHHKHQYPTTQQRQDFIEAYLKKLHDSVEGYACNADEVAGVEEEVCVFSMFSHLFWSLWSVVNVSSNIEFGYWEYAVTRIQEFLSLKERYIKSHAVDDTISN